MMFGTIRRHRVWENAPRQRCIQPPNSLGLSLVLVVESACSIHADQTAKGKTTHRRMGMIHLQNLPRLHNDRDAIRFQRCASHSVPTMRLSLARRQPRDTRVLIASEL